MTRGTTMLGLFVGALLALPTTMSPASAGVGCQPPAADRRVSTVAPVLSTDGSDSAATDPTTAPADAPDGEPSPAPTPEPTEAPRVVGQGDQAASGHPADDTVDPEVETTPPTTSSPEDIAEPADLSIQASASPLEVGPDEVVTLTITIYNSGPGDEPSVTVSDVIPEGAVLAAPVAGLDASTGVLELGELPVGESVTVTIPLLFPDQTGSVQTTPMVHGETSDVYPIDDQACTEVSVTRPETAAPAPAGDDEPVGGGGGMAGGGPVTGTTTATTSPTMPQPGSSIGGGETAPSPGTLSASPQAPDPTVGGVSTGGGPRSGGRDDRGGEAAVSGVEGSVDGSGGASRQSAVDPDGAGGSGGSGGPEARSVDAEPISGRPADGGTAALNALGLLLLLAGGSFLLVGAGRHYRLWS